MNRTSCIVSFGSNALAIGADASIAEINGDLQPFADLDALELGTVAAKPYATYEPNYWLLDGNFKFTPDANARGGWVSTVMSGSTGGFDIASPFAELQIDFDDVHSTDGIYLTFSNTGDYADTVRIVFYNAALATILDATYNPTGETFFTNQAIADFKRILISIRSTNRAQRYARLMQIDFDTVTEFSGADIKAARVVEEINPLSLELPINTLELDLFSTDGDFSIVAPAGFYASLQYKEPLDIHEEINGSVIYIGRFYLDAWESLSENEARFEASDAMGLMDGSTYYGIFRIGPHSPDYILSEDLIDEIMGVAGIGYEIDPSLEGVEVTGLIRVSTCREALQQVMISLGAYATCSRSNVVQIKPFELAADLAVYDHALTSAEKGIVSPITLRPLITGVELSEHNFAYRAIPDTEIFNETLAVGTHIITPDIVAIDLDITGSTATWAWDFDYSYTPVLVAVVTVAGIVKVTAQSELADISKVIGEYNLSLPAGTPSNIIKIEDATLVSVSIVNTVAQRVYDYFAQRYLQKTKLFGSLLAPGDSVLVDVQSSRQLKGIVERMETDLSGGYVSNVEIVGVVI